MIYGILWKLVNKDPPERGHRAWPAHTPGHPAASFAGTRCSQSPVPDLGTLPGDDELTEEHPPVFPNKRK